MSLCLGKNRWRGVIPPGRTEEDSGPASGGQEGALRTADDLRGFADLLVQLPTLGLLLWYIQKRHPDPAFLRRYNLWCLLVLGAYAISIAIDLWLVVVEGKKKNMPRLVMLLTSLLSFLLFANINYFNHVLLQRMTIPGDLDCPDCLPASKEGKAPTTATEKTPLTTEEQTVPTIRTEKTPPTTARESERSV